MAKRVKNYLITGFSGFVSRYFVEYLNQTQEKAKDNQAELLFKSGFLHRKSYL